MLIRKWIPQSMDSAAPYSQTRIGLSQWGTIISGSNIVAFCNLLNIIKASNCGVENGDRFLYYIAHGWWCICDDYMMMIFFWLYLQYQISISILDIYTANRLTPVPGMLCKLGYDNIPSLVLQVVNLPYTDQRTQYLLTVPRWRLEPTFA